VNGSNIALDTNEAIAVLNNAGDDTKVPTVQCGILIRRV